MMEKAQKLYEKYQTRLYDAEESAWAVLAAKAESVKMPRKLVAAIRQGFTFLRMIDADLERLANMRGVVQLVVDSYAQDLARGGRAST